MADRIQIRRGLSTNRLSEIPAPGEILFDTDTRKLWIGDAAATPGGVAIAGGSTTTILNELNDVDTTGVANGDILVFNAGSGAFEPEPNVHFSGDYNDLTNQPTIPVNLDDLGDTDLVGVTDGQVLTFVNASGKWEPVTSVAAGLQDTWEIIEGDGSSVISPGGPGVTLRIAGGTGISTVVSGTTLTITNTAPDSGGDLLSVNNLSDVANAQLSIDNLSKTSTVEVDQLRLADHGSNAQTWLIEEDQAGSNSLTFDYNGIERARLTPLGDLTIGGTTTFNSVTYTWPGSAGSAGQFLTTDGFGTLSFTTAAEQNLWATFNADTGTTTADTTTDTLTITGGSNITTAIASDTLVISNDAPNIVQNLWLNINADTGTTNAESATDTLTFTGGTNVTTSISGDVVTIDAVAGSIAILDEGVPVIASAASMNFVGPNVTATTIGAAVTVTVASQNLWSTISSDSGSTAANTLTDTLTVEGANGILTSIAGDTLTIGNESPNVIQNVYLTVAGDTGNTSANTSTDTLNIVGGAGITTVATLDTLTITSSATAPDLWLTFNADSGSTFANSTADAFTLTGGTGITTSIAGDIITITNDSPNVTQNLWLNINSDSGTTNAESATDTLIFAGGTGISTSITLDTVTITNDSPNVIQNVYITVAGDTGNTTANTSTDTLNIIGGTGITTIATSDTLTITNSASSPNLWATFNADSGSTAANTTTDTLTVEGGTGISTSISADTLTVTNDSPNIDQDIWLTVAGDTGSTAASATNTTLTIEGGTNVTTSMAGNVLTINASGGGSGVTVKDEGNDVAETPHTGLNFVGTGVTATDGGSGIATITIPGASGGGEPAEFVKIDYTVAGLVGSTSFSSGISGVVITNTAANNVTIAVTFSGSQTRPPSSIIYWGYKFDLNEYHSQVPSVGQPAKIQPGGSPGSPSPDPFGSFSSSTVITLKVDRDETGATNKSTPSFDATHAYIQFGF